MNNICLINKKVYNNHKDETEVIQMMNISKDII